MRWGLTILCAALLLAYSVGMALGVLLLRGQDTGADRTPHTTTTTKESHP